MKKMLSPLQKNHNKEKGGCQKKTFSMKTFSAPFPASSFSLSCLFSLHRHRMGVFLFRLRYIHPPKETEKGLKGRR
jgi:hypothetical protein